MKQRERLSAFLRPLDFAVFATVLLLAALLFCLPLLCGTGESLSVTTSTGVTTYPLALDRTLTLTGNGYTLTVQIAGGCVRVTDTTCPEEICRRTGIISRSGETILCSRAGILLSIVGEGGYDAVAG